MRFYVASRLENADVVRDVRDKMLKEGHALTYDWTIAGSVRGDLAKLREVAEAETRGVAEADILILLLPGGRGAHVELGIALGCKKPVVIWSEDLMPLGAGKETSAFYHHPLVSFVYNRETIPKECARRLQERAA